MTMHLTAWIAGQDRVPSPSVRFTVIDGKEICETHPEVVEDLARRMMEAKISRTYLETYGSRLGWPVVGRRLQQTKQKVARGDFGEVVASGWLEDYCGLHAPIRKMRAQVGPGQTLPGVDTIAFRVTDELIDGIHVLESKLRTTPARLTAVGVEAYQQLEKDRNERAVDLLEYALEQLHTRGDPFAEALCKHLENRVDESDDSYEVVLVVESDVWDEEVLTQLDAVAGSLPNCRLHVLLCSNLVALVDAVYDRAGLDLVDRMET